MIKINENADIVYNAKQTMITLNKNTKGNEYFFMFYRNRDNISDEYIKNNLNEHLRLKDKIKIMLDKSPLNRNYKGYMALAGKVWYPLTCNFEANKQHCEIWDTIANSMTDGQIVKSGDIMGQYLRVVCPENELQNIVNNLAKLEKKHKKEELESQNSIEL